MLCYALNIKSAKYSANNEPPFDMSHLMIDKQKLLKYAALKRCFRICRLLIESYDTDIIQMYSTDYTKTPLEELFTTEDDDSEDISTNTLDTNGIELAYYFLTFSSEGFHNALYQCIKKFDAQTVTQLIEAASHWLHRDFNLLTGGQNYYSPLWHALDKFEKDVLSSDTLEIIKCLLSYGVNMD